ncbi:MAG: xanthine dehydrogenase family protein molybdopterin-binding subunit [Peptococcaceae bacterium]|nr:xanthine dehydrogenase family protein molybdopterin-binding subunit [Peptococcaceae bacterium]
MSEDYKVVGKGLPRIDGPGKVTGQAVFTVDVSLPGMLYGKILRSPYPHARIKGIDTSAAGRLPGVKMIMTGLEVAGIRYAFVDTPRYPADEQPLAVDKVRYIGDEVAAVAAESEETAGEALALIKVDYEVLPAVFEMEQAILPSAPIIHDEQLEGTSAWEDWGVTKKSAGVIEGEQKEIPNLSGRTTVSFGDVELGFQEADYVREDRFELKATAHCAMEPHAAVASYDPVADKLHVWLSTQGIFLKRYFLSRALKMPESRIRVHHTYCGGAFGGKIDLFPYEFCAAYLSRKLGRPVKIELEREEVFMTTRQRHPMIITLKTGVKKDGSIVAQDIKVMADNGGYRGSGPIVVFLCHGFSFPVYNVPHYRYEGLAVYTNNPVRGPQRAHGSPQIRYAIDSQLDLICRELGLDVVDVMLRNVRRQGDRLPNGDRLNSCGLTECIKEAAKSIHWNEKRPPSPGREKTGRYRTGVGISLCAMFSGAMYYPFASAALVKMQDDGSATLFIGAQEIGQGSYTTMAQVLAEELGLGLDDIQVVAGDTELSPIDIGSFLSGTAMITGNAVRLAAADVKRQLFDVSREMMGLDNSAVLRLQDKKVYPESNPEVSVPLRQVLQTAVFKRQGNPVIGHGSYKGYPETDRYPGLSKAKGLFTSAYGFAAQAAEVEVDTVTGRVRLLRAATLHDCGFPLNRNIVEGQVHGCVSMGTGQALSEAVSLEKGQLFNPSFLDYQLPIAPDTPESIEGIVNSLEPNGPFGAKEVGEGAISGILGAIANATHDAIGVRIYSLPITPEKVLGALEQGKAGS